MQFVKQSFEILNQEIPVRKPDDSNESYKNKYLESMYKHIERCGKICYRAEHNITEDSYMKFIKRMIESQHYSVLEHGVIYLKFHSTEHLDIYKKYQNNSFSKVNTSTDYGKAVDFITTNYRVIVENHWEDDLQYLCEPTFFHEKRYTVLLHSCIHVYKDLTRHRKMSFSIESTRYCNYSRTERFGEMKFVLPPWTKYGNTGNADITDKLDMYYPYTEDPEAYFTAYLQNCKIFYNRLIEFGWQPQQAAEILPQCTAADVVMSGFVSDWEFVFSLRTDIAATGQPHPLVKEIMNPLYDEFINRKYINERRPI